MPKAWELAVNGQWQVCYRVKFPNARTMYDIVSFSRSRKGIRLTRFSQDGKEVISYTDPDQELKLVKKPPQLFGRPELPATFKDEPIGLIP